MTRINPYLIFDGNCEEAFNFYKSVFGGEFEFFGRFNEMQKKDGYNDPMPEEFGNRIMHASLPIGKNMLMGSDSNPNLGKVTIGQNVNISINTDTKEEADRLFVGFSKYGTITMPMEDTFWGDYFGMVVDQFGIEWMLSFKKPQ